MSRTGRQIVLVCAFLGWFFAGVQLSITSLAMRSAAIDLLGRTDQIDIDQFKAFNRRIGAGEAPLTESETTQLDDWKSAAASWFAMYQCAFLFGAASGGLLFGRFGDRFGRKKALAASILCYSLVSAVTVWVETPGQLVGLRFLACLGVGGTWPNGVALVAEVWSGLSRPVVAGVIGSAANIGIFLMATLASYVEITPESWRWVMLVAATPVVLGLFTWFATPESPAWLASRRKGAADDSHSAEPSPSPSVFRPPYLAVTLVGILLATIPLFGGWGSANWMIPWAGEAGEAADPPDPFLKARVQQCRSITGTLGSLLGGWIASLVGRRITYCLISVGALICAQIAFWLTVPTDPSFLFWVAALGWFNGIYFGWLPLCLPELFPTRVRATGAGVSFNSGRIITAITIFATGWLMHRFDGDYARIGQITSFIFAIGILAVWLAPDTSRRKLEDSSEEM